VSDARYDYPFNPDPAVSPYGWAVSRVQAGARVLDLGCGSGVVFRHLAEALGCDVRGVDRQRHPALEEAAFEQLDLERDRERLAQVVREFAPDVVLLLDVLEHLREPAELLELLAGCLPAEARLLVSLPNASNASVVLRLLSDDFAYQEDGLLDRDHLRHFTARTARALLRGAGFGVRRFHSTRIPLQAQNWRAPFASGDVASLARLASEVNAGASAYQLCLEASLGVEDEPALVDGRLSVVLRTHDPARLPQLDQALFSLALQAFEDLEVVVVVQGGAAAHLRAIEAAVEGQPWRAGVLRRVVSLDVRAGDDARARLLNLGVETASGRYLAFLDDDDLVYHHAYTTLIDELRRSGRALAIGGCRVATLRPGQSYVTKKGQPFAYDSSASPTWLRVQLFAANFVPIHSYVIDRRRLGAFELRFAADWTLLEDYEFLLRVCAVFEPSFACLDQPLGEYRFEEPNPREFFRTGDRSRTPEDRERCLAAEGRLAARRQELVCLLPLAEVAQAFLELQAVRRGIPYRLAKGLADRLQSRPRLHGWLRSAGRRLWPGA
jgi:SAM-dependent methyltransferase